jgi:hypothetical protein
VCVPFEGLSIDGRVTGRSPERSHALSRVILNDHFCPFFLTSITLVHI